MINKYLLIAIVGGVFIVGIGSGYVISQSLSSVTVSQQQMQYMMNDPQMRQQMMDTMMQHQEMRSSMMQNKSMMNMMMSKDSTMSNSMMQNNQMTNPMTKQQNRNQIGMMLQDPTLKQQMKELLLQQNIESANIGNEILANGHSSDGTVSVEIKSSTPMPGKFLEIIETFQDKNGGILEHVNHDIHVTQDGQTVLKMSELHSHHGEITYYTRELHSDGSVKVEVLMHGIGMEAPLTGPIDEVIIVEIS